MKDRILVFGGQGRLGQSMIEYFPEVLVIGKDLCDITDRKKVLETISTSGPSVVINAAAVTSPRTCEEDPQLAWSVNVYGARNVAWACGKQNIYSIQISSNWAAEPVNEYGVTKLVSESAGADLSIRVCYYDEHYWMFDQLSRGQSVRLLESDSFNPISVLGLLRALEFHISRRSEGIRNVGTKDRLSHYDFGIEVCRTLGFGPDLIQLRQDIPEDLGYTYPVNTYLDPGSAAPRLSTDLLEFRNSMLWKYRDDTVETATSGR